MIPRLLLIIIASYFHITSHAQITFQKVMGGPGSKDYLKDVQQTMDGGFIFCGYTNSSGAGDKDVYLLKTDNGGNILWSKTFGGANWDEGNSIIQSNDGGYVLTGITFSYGAGGCDVYLLKTDGSGNILWSKTFGGSDWDRGYSTIQTNDGGYLITGLTKSFGAGVGDVYLVKTDGSGNLSWSKTYGGNGLDLGNSVIQSTDGGFVITGYTMSYGAGSDDVYLLKTDITGNLLWSSTFGGNSSDYGNSVIQSSDGSYVVTGYTSSYGAGKSDIYVVKADNSGKILWSKTYGGVNWDEGNSIIQSIDGNYVITGSTMSYGAGFTDAFLLKITDSGNHLFGKAYGGTDADYNYSLIQSSDGGFLTIGATHTWDANPFNGVGDEFYIVKTDSNGNSGCNEIDFIPQIVAGAIEGTGAIEGSGAITGTGSIENNWIPDTITLCYKEVACTAVNANSVQQNNSCYQQCDGIITVIPQAGTGPFTYLWNPPVAPITDSIGSNLCSGDYSVLVTGSDGCDTTLNFMITEPLELTASIIQTNLLCFKDSNALAATTAAGGTAPYIYRWDDPGNQTSQTAINLPAGSYTVTLTDENNCQVEQSITITQPEELIATILSENATCNKNNGTATAIVNGGTGIIAYQWNDLQNQSDQQITGLSDATYSVTITDANGCSTKATTTIAMATSNPMVAAWPDTSISQGESVQIHSSGGDTCLWTPSTALSNPTSCDPIASPNQTTTYIVEITENNCKSWDTVTIIVEYQNFVVYIPNAFTPTKDNRNDLFEIKGVGVEDYHLRIFNRWGEMIFQSNSINTSWDGRVYGKNEVQLGTYINSLDVGDSQIQQNFIGKVTLLR